MELAARTGAWTPSRALLPYLRRVAWLYSDGNQYCIFGAYEIDEETEIVLQVERTSAKTDDRIFGQSYYDNSFGYCPCGESHRCCTVTWLAWGSAPNFYSNPKIDIVASTNEIAFYSPANREKIWNETEYVISSGSVQPITAFCCVTRDMSVFRIGTSTRIFGIRFNNRTTCISLIPVLDLSGRPCFYDEVSGQFFYNQGTGEFTWGELDTARARFFEGGGTKCLTPRRSYRRLARPSARFCAHSQEWEVAA